MAAAEAVVSELAEVLGTLAGEVKKRLDDEAAPRPPTYLLFHGLQRARDLRAEDDLGSRYDDSGAPPTPASQLASVLREGPDVGVHAIVWCDTAHNLGRSLQRAGQAALSDEPGLAEEAQ